MQTTRSIRYALLTAGVAMIVWQTASILLGQTATPPANPATVTIPPATPNPTATPATPATQPAKTATPAAPTTRPAVDETKLKPKPKPADAKQLGGEPESIVQVANLIYAGTKSSKCFSDHFLVKAEKESAISTSRRFHAVKLDSDELFAFPLVIMTGEGAFELPKKERENLRSFVDRGGFLLASAGCSSREWDQSLRHEFALIFPEYPLEEIGMDHPIFHTVYEINILNGLHSPPRPLEGITVHGHLGVLYSQEGLNDTSHTQGCCCCGGNEITNAVDVNVNILAYALVY